MPKVPHAKNLFLKFSRNLENFRKNSLENYLGRVAENNRLIDLKLGEEGIQAVNFLFFSNKGIVLGHTLQGQLLHKVDLTGRFHMLLHEYLKIGRQNL